MESFRSIALGIKYVLINDMNPASLTMGMLATFPVSFPIHYNPRLSGHTAHSLSSDVPIPPPLPLRPASVQDRLETLHDRCPLDLPSATNLPLFFKKHICIYIYFNFDDTKEVREGRGKRSHILIITTAIKYCTIDTTHLAGGKRRMGFLPSSLTCPAPRRKRPVASSEEEEEYR
jgi:hypothetical protein